MMQAWGSCQPLRHEHETKIINGINTPNLTNDPKQDEHPVRSQENLLLDSLLCGIKIKARVRKIQCHEFQVNRLTLNKIANKV